MDALVRDYLVSRQYVAEADLDLEVMAVCDGNRDYGCIASAFRADDPAKLATFQLRDDQLLPVAFALLRAWLSTRLR